MERRGRHARSARRPTLFAWHCLTKPHRLVGIAPHVDAVWSKTQEFSAMRLQSVKARTCACLRPLTKKRLRPCNAKHVDTCQPLHCEHPGFLHAGRKTGLRSWHCTQMGEGGMNALMSSPRSIQTCTHSCNRGQSLCRKTSGTKLTVWRLRGPLFADLGMHKKGTYRSDLSTTHISVPSEHLDLKAYSLNLVLKQVGGGSPSPLEDTP